MEQAIEDLKSQEREGSVDITSTAKKYGVERSTLSRRYRGVITSRTKQYEKQRLLNDQQETELVRYIEKLCERGLPPTREMLQGFASEICQKPVGNHWPDRFIQRHQIELVSRWAMSLDTQRKRADSAFKYKLYFELLARKIEQYNVEPQHIYNMDEKGFLIGVLSKSKRIFSRQRYEKQGLKHIIQDGNREWITCIACICADGSALSPSLIYRAATGHVQDGWLQDFDPTAHSCFFASSPNGWTSNELGLQWLQQVFNRETKAKARRAYRLLILDGHGSHVSMSFIEFCDRNRILLAIYPPHSTHTLQPLDVCVFSPLAAAYTKQLQAYMNDSMGFTRLTKRDFFRLFWQAWPKALTTANILSGFEKCGLHPFKPQRVLNRFNTESSSRPSSSESSYSVLSASDWKRIDKILRNIVADICDQKATQLSNTMYSLSMKNMLLQQENDRLNRALINERKKRKPQKALQLDLPDDYNGGAVFYSPNKVQQARDREAEKEAAVIHKQQLKLEDIQRREAERAEKAALAEQRKQARSKAREIRLQQAEEKRLQKEEAQQAKEANRQLQNEATIKRTSKKPSQAIQALQQLANEAQSSIEVVEQPERVNRKGRAIRLPTRFQE